MDRLRTGRKQRSPGNQAGAILPLGLHCSGCRAAPNFESGANAFRPFPHTWESPMSVASRMQHLRIDPAAIVADDYPKALGRIFKFDLDAAGSGVAECIHPCFAADTIELVADDPT